MRFVAAGAVFVGLVFVSPVAHADLGERPECEGGSTPDSVTGVCISRPDPDPEPDPDPTPSCAAEPLSWEELNSYSFIDPNIQFGDGYRYYPDNGRANRETPDGEVEYGTVIMAWDPSTESCEARGFIWVPDGTPEPDPVEVSIDEASERVPLPELDISPSLAAGGVVKLGMWLAVSNPDDVSATANGRGTSVTATATLADTTWEMGDGTTVPCDGGGEPIDPSSAAFESLDEGPCGHTYDEPGSFTITVTTTWTVSWVATDGRSGTAPAIVRSDTFDYDVLEIQTVGRNN